MMEFRGELKSFFRNTFEDEYEITFSVKTESALRQVETLKGELDIEVKKHREKRSLDSNAYAWVLMQKIAEVLHTDKWSVYLEMLKSYGQFTHIWVKPEAVESVIAEWRTAVVLGESEVGGEPAVQIQVYFGSSTYDTKEMSFFLEGVVREAEWLGIQTMTPEEIERMNSLWLG